MALPVLDGNQTATTLSSVVTGGEHIVAHSVVSLGANAIANITSAVSGSVVSISNFPASQSTTFGAVTGSVSVLNLPSTQTIAGTVTANGGDFTSTEAGSPPSRGVLVGGQSSGEFRSLSVNASGVLAVGIADSYVDVPISGTVTVSSLPASTVTVSALPSGALTTRFGSVTTANTAQITSAVTNTNRKYLLAQNISAGTVTIGIGFSPTTTQGIQLTAGGGLTFDAFCPTGAVYWLGAVTGAAFTILEG